MRKSALLLCGTALAVTLSACAGDGRERVAIGVSGPVDYDAYYDDYYGPFYDGYWAPDGFYFSDGDGHPFRRDDGGHFHREVTNGFHGVHGHPHPAGHDGDGMRHG